MYIQFRIETHVGNSICSLATSQNSFSFVYMYAMSRSTEGENLCRELFEEYITQLKEEAKGSQVQAQRRRGKKFLCIPF